MVKETKKQTAKPVAEKEETKQAEGDSFREIVRALKFSTRGRLFQGKVIRKFPKRVTIEFERTIKIPKFERFMKKKTRIHARLPDEFAGKVHVGDLIKVHECRPLSKIIHFVVVEKIRSGEGNESKDEK